MKEIKFRQRNKNNDHLHYWGLVDGKWINPKTTDNYIPPYESDEYTGSKDKNDIDIYNNDTLQIQKKGIGYDNSDHIVFCQVKWDTYDDGEYICHLYCWMIDDIPLSDIDNATYGHPKCIVKIVNNIQDKL